MRPDCRYLILACSVFLLATGSAWANPSVAEVLHEAYMTRLFALETRLAVLSSRDRPTPKDRISLSLLKTERDRLRRRVKVSKHYVRKRPARPQSRMKRGSIEAIIAKKAKRYGIDPDFVHAIIKCESNYDAHALSRVGAMGLMQLMPETAAELGVKNPWSPTENIDGGVRYIVALLREFKDPWKAVASYNCGPGIFRKGLPVPTESRLFANKVLRVFAGRRAKRER